MLKFKKLKWKNFLSTGNNWTEIDLIATSSTLIVGGNGSGKSTMLDALSYGLFGKAHRNINIPQLVNTVNRKECKVEVEFETAGSSFKVIRGLKPVVFEIYKNGELINQESTNKEYQKLLETNIIKLNHKSFHQIVVLGSSSFIPFMQLPAQHRRDIIEDLLDINVFSKMNFLMKEKASILKETQRDLKYKIESLGNSIDTQNKYIENINSMNEEQIEEKKRHIEKTMKQIDELQEENTGHSLFLSKNSEIIEEQLHKANDKKTQILNYQFKFKSEITSLVKEISFYEENENCPTCHQDIEEKLRNEKLKEGQIRAKTLNSEIRKSQEMGKETLELISKLTKEKEIALKHQNKMNENNKEIQLLHNNIKSYNNSIDKILGRDTDLTKARSELKELLDEMDLLNKRRYELSEQQNYNSVISEMLKDTGIKTKVIKQYLPVMNKLINQYLQVLDFFVHFNLDESFNETLRSRHRDTFTYTSFSEGEKQRIDLALLFTWRMIAKMKNSISTNLLILDETFDSSLDHDGVDNLIKILYTLDHDTNTFIISHKGEILENKFKRKLEFVKDKNFSKVI